MSRCRFVQPEVVRLELSEGHFIDVKKELNAGEQRAVFGRLVKDLHFGEKANLDPEQVGLTKIVAYLVGWSFPDADGHPVPCSEAAINNLDGATYQEIVAAVDAHEAAVDLARTERKNDQTGASSSSVTL